MGMVAAALLTGCKSELIEQSPDNAITFKAFINNITRSSGNQQIDRFAVYGIMQDDKNEKSVLFDKKEVSLKDGKYSYEPVAYWTEHNNYWFTGILPYEGNWLLEGYSDNIQQTRGTLFFDNEKAQGKEDLMVAIEKPVENAVPSIQPDVDFNFLHQLSGIYFRFQNAYPADAAYSIRISGVELENVLTSATMDLTDENAVWTPKGGETTFQLDMEESDALRPGTADLSGTERVFVFPGNGERHLKFTVELYFKNTDEAAATFSHRITLPYIEMKKGYCYDVKAIINENNVDPVDGNEPITIIVNEIEKWPESPETGGGEI